MNDESEKCVMCGNPIPEGGMICDTCRTTYEQAEIEERKAFPEKYASKADAQFKALGYEIKSETSRCVIYELDESGVEYDSQYNEIKIPFFRRITIYRVGNRNDILTAITDDRTSAALTKDELMAAMTKIKEMMGGKHDKN